MARGRVGGPKRLAMTAASPLIREVLRRRSPYRGKPGRYADPWALISATWGDPSPDPDNVAAVED